jgi:drug/metabolite transporter (DMT)-like permease
MDITLTKTLGVGLAALALAGIVVVLASGASAQDPTTRTLTFKALDKGSTFTHVRNTKPKSERSNSTGDGIVFTNPLADASGSIVGKQYADCTTTKGARNFLRSTTTCVVVIDLRDGSLTLQANSKPGVPTTTGAVTGGTRSYANARGVFVADDRSGDLTITLAE